MLTKIHLSHQKKTFKKVKTTTTVDKNTKSRIKKCIVSFCCPVMYLRS